MANPDAAIVTLLDALTTPVALTENFNLFYGPERSTAECEDTAVFVLETGGRENRRMLGTANHRYKVHTIQVLVRGPQHAYVTGKAIADACFAALDHPTPPSGYMSCAPREPGPVYLGEDAERMHAWSMNVELERVVTT